MNFNKSITLATEKYVDDTILETQSDWEQSDSSKPDFIKNKTHYDTRESGGELKRLDKKYLPEDTVFCNSESKRIDKEYLPESTVFCNSAKIGQIIVVKAVDENGTPTEWEAVDGQNSRDNIVLKNKDGYEFIVYMDGETLASKMKLQEIKVTKLPDKTDYTDTELFDPTGMVVVGVTPTGKEEAITNYTYDRFVTTESVTHMLTYIDEFGDVYTTTVPITTRTLLEALGDFNYKTNSDGTYTITGWKGTFNGSDSKKFIVPNSELIRI